MTSLHYGGLFVFNNSHHIRSMHRFPVHGTILLWIFTMLLNSNTHFISQSTVDSWKAPVSGWGILAEKYMEISPAPQKPFTYDVLCELSTQIENVLTKDGFIGVCDASWVQSGYGAFCAALMGSNVEVQERSGKWGRVLSCNNQAEYEALKELTHMANATNRPCLLFSDSLTQIERFLDEHELPSNITLRWVPRRLVGPANAKARAALGLSSHAQSKDWKAWLNKLRFPVSPENTTCTNVCITNPVAQKTHSMAVQ